MMKSTAPASAVNERFNVDMRAIVYFVSRRAEMRQLLASLFAVTAIAAQTTQSPETGAAAFEVASVKRNNTGAPGGSFVMPPGRFTATNIPLKVLITNAYQLSFFQVGGGPDWVTSARLAMRQLLALVPMLTVVTLSAQTAGTPVFIGGQQPPAPPWDAPHL